MIYITIYDEHSAQKRWKEGRMNKGRTKEGQRKEESMEGWTKEGKKQKKEGIMDKQMNDKSRKEVRTILFGK